jgi:hypothetical protein
MARDAIIGGCSGDCRVGAEVFTELAVKSRDSAEEATRLRGDNT